MISDNLSFYIRFLWEILTYDMQAIHFHIFEEWCDKSEFTPDCDENEVKRTDSPKPPSSVSWMQIPYPLTSIPYPLTSISYPRVSLLMKKGHGHFQKI